MYVKTYVWETKKICFSNLQWNTSSMIMHFVALALYRGKCGTPSVRRLSVTQQRTGLHSRQTSRCRQTRLPRRWGTVGSGEVAAQTRGSSYRPLRGERSHQLRGYDQEAWADTEEWWERWGGRCERVAMRGGSLGGERTKKEKSWVLGKGWKRLKENHGCTTWGSVQSMKAGEIRETAKR